MKMIQWATGGDDYLPHQLNGRDLDDCRVMIFDTIYKVFKVVCSTNNVIYNWKEKGASQGDIYWRKNFINSTKDSYNHDNRWDKLIVSKTPK